VVSTATELSELLALPARVGDYQLERLAGEGGTAFVYYGRAIASGDEVAVKVLKPTYQERGLAEPFIEQGRQLSELSSPYLPALLECGSSALGPWWVMRWVEGPTLHELLERGAQWGAAGVYHLAFCLIEALRALHERGLIHGDVKPANLIYSGPPQSPLQAKLTLIDPRLTTPSPSQSPSGERPLIEYSRALQQGEQDPSLLPERPFIFGTPAYMSPEQLKGEPLKPASDLYSFGVLLYQLTTGVCPYAGELKQIIHDKLHGELPPPSVRHRPWPYPAALEALIHNTTSKSLPVRLQSAAEVQGILLKASGREQGLSATASNAPWLSQTAPGESGLKANPELSHLNAETIDLEITESTTIRAVNESELNAQRPQALTARRATEERPVASSTAWLSNLLWLLSGAIISFVLMRLLS